MGPPTAAALWNSPTYKLPGCFWALTSPRQVSQPSEPLLPGEFPCFPLLWPLTSITRTPDRVAQQSLCVLLPPPGHIIFLNQPPDPLDPV